MKILVLLGGDSPEREVSLRSGQAVMAALEKKNHTVVSYDPADGDQGLMQAVQSADSVFPILHGLHGEDGTIQKKLEDLDKPFLGADSLASKNAFFKDRTRSILESHGIRMPRGEVVTKDTFQKSELTSKPFVLKPIDGGSSVDTVIARSPNDIDKQALALQLLDSYQTMLLEECIIGQEITVPVVGEQVLPVIAIVPPSGEEFDFDNKYNGKTSEICPVPYDRLSNTQQERAQALALKVHRILGVRHVSRTDIMIDEAGEMYVLELNTIPGMTAQSLLPKAALVAGYDMPTLVDKLAELTVAKK